MIRTQVSLHKETYQLAREEARRQGISLAELFRRSLNALLTPDRSRPWMRYQGLVATGNPQSSQKIDEVVYGLKD